MATIKVELSLSDVREACEYWATRMVLNEGSPVSSSINYTGQVGSDNRQFTGYIVVVETDRMKVKR